MTPRQLREAQLRVEREEMLLRQAAMLREQREQQALQQLQSITAQQVQRLVQQDARQELTLRQRASDKEQHASQEVLRERIATLLAEARNSRGGRKRILEQPFEDAWKARYPDVILVPEHRVLRFKIDFAHTASMTAIELDGDRYHRPSTDYPRQEAITDVGWHFIRFSGRQILEDVDRCVDRAYRIISERAAR